MPKKILTCLLPPLVAGCAGLHASPPPQTPALVFIDGQILESTRDIAQAQQRIAPVVAPPALISPTVSSPAVAGTRAVQTPSSAIALSRLKQSGTPATAPVIALPPVRNLTVTQWVQKLLPPGWQRLQANAATPALNTRLASWSANDQWTRSLNRLLEEQHLYGSLDWDKKTLTVTTTPGAASDGGTAAPVTTVPSSAPRNPFSSASSSAAATAVATPAPAAPRWTAAAGSTLRETLVRWAGTASCSASGGFWTVIWPDTVADYRLDAPLTFSGTFEDMLGQVFSLYATADTPLNARASRSQCVVAVSDQSAR
ncbi:toxin co-regulated pilus biosynthesis Q family protein [Klebsiella michiganensis]|uniref:toxin co-regulated pilus biosynthesis Q family protein n=1 Tax=Klebsiella michiganensis TaxID=1134687 RepID=UPI003DA9887B